MKKRILDLRHTHDRDTLFDKITDVFDVPDYFGRNLDALYDCLTEISEDTCIALVLPDGRTGLPDQTDTALPEQADDGLQELPALDGPDRASASAATPVSFAEPEATPDNEFPAYLQKLRRTFEDAEEENPHLWVLVVA